MKLRNNGRFPRVIIGFFGKIIYSRTMLTPTDSENAQKLYDLEKIKSIFPLDCALGVDVIPFKMTLRFLCAVAREGVIAKSYKEASANIWEKYNVRLNAAQVERATIYVGSYVWSAQYTEAQLAKRHLQERKVNTKYNKYSNDILYIASDGAMIHLLGDEDRPDGWAESKHAVAFHSSDIVYSEGSNGEPTHKILKKDFVGFIGPASEFMYHFLALALRNHCEECSKVVVLSDGATWIHKMVLEVLPGAEHILDLYHAKENAWKFANAVKRSEKSRKQFGETLCNLIEEGKVEELLDILSEYKERKLPIGVPNLYVYIENHKDCMNYPLYKEKGYFVGSRSIESGNKQLTQNRMKLQGMIWSPDNAQFMLSLKAKYESDNWKDVIKIMYLVHYHRSPPIFECENWNHNSAI